MKTKTLNNNFIGETRWRQIFLLFGMHFIFRQVSFGLLHNKQSAILSSIRRKRRYYKTMIRRCSSKMIYFDTQANGEDHLTGELTTKFFIL